jgi:rRNA maturation endonuclease Nob1
MSKKIEDITMKCPKCQSENPEGYKFCGECGGKLKIMVHRGLVGKLRFYSFFSW